MTDIESIESKNINSNVITKLEAIDSKTFKKGPNQFVQVSNKSQKDYLFETNGNEYILTRDPIKITIKNHKFVKHFEAQVQINGICYKPCETVFLSRTLDALLDYIRIEARTEKFSSFVGVVEKNRFIKALDKWFAYN